MNIENLRKFAASTKHEFYDEQWEGGTWLVDMVETQETLEDFKNASKDWQYCSKMEDGALGGVSFISWSNMQSMKGYGRQSLSIIDLGDCRVALPGTDLSLYF